MAIAGALVVPVNAEDMETLSLKLRGVAELEIQATDAKGIAVVLEADEVRSLEQLCEEIADWEEVLEINLAYLNWEKLE